MKRPGQLSTPNKIDVLSEEQLRKTFDLLTEGIHVVDSKWNCIYVNNIIFQQKAFPAGKTIGGSMFDLYPAIENTKLYNAIQHCMITGRGSKIEVKLIYSDKTGRWMNFQIEPVDEGILLISQDINNYRQADEKMRRAMNLYSFVSQINQNIVRVADEKTLYRNACEIAIEFGKFKIAWIGIFDQANKRISLVEQSGVPENEIATFINSPVVEAGPQDRVLTTGKHYLCNDPGDEVAALQSHSAHDSISSCIVLPIRREGTIIGTLNLYSGGFNLSGTEEVDLLIKAAANISFALDVFEKDKRQKETEELVLKNERKFRNTLDHMLEGVQIHDFDWRYIYVNDPLVGFSTYSKEELLGYTLMEKYPGIEQTALFETFQRCMINRTSEQMDTEFVFPNGSRADFELSIQPIPEGIFILSVDRTEQKRSREKLIKVSRLYSFLSAINQSINHIQNEEELMEKVCRIAVDIGQFAIAWVDRIDPRNGIVNTTNIQGALTIIPSTLNHFRGDRQRIVASESPTGRALRSGKYAVSNDVLNDPEMKAWHEELKKNSIKSLISLPIKRSGEVIGTLGLSSLKENFFDQEEISLLVEATDDISFALDQFQKAAHHKETEELLLENEMRFRALIEKSSDMITLATPSGKLLYISPSVTKVLGYTIDELEHKQEGEFIHPEDIDEFRRLVGELLKHPGESFSNEQRVLHKNGTWLWCEGTVTNLLHQEGVLAIVSNFRDISEKKSLQEQRDFNKNNLKALINNTTDLMWSVDRNLNLITSNTPFDNMVKYMSGKVIAKGSSVLAGGGEIEQTKRFKGYYERALAGETFTEIEYTPPPTEVWSEISYHPILLDDEVVGTACYSRDISDLKRGENKLRWSEVFNRGVLNSLSSRIAVISGSGAIVATNQAWKLFAEADNSSAHKMIVGSNYFNFYENEALAGNIDARGIFLGMKNVMEERNSVFYFEYPYHSEKISQWFAMRVMKFDSDEPMIVVAHEDISERKKAEAMLIENNGELHKTNEELDRFVYSASHDLRAPLSSVLGLVTLIELETKEATSLEYAGMIGKSIRRLDEFIKNILKYSKNNRLDPEIGKIAILKTVQEVVSALHYMKEASGVEFEIIGDDQPAFYSNLQRFSIILENLIANALRFQDYNKASRFVKIKWLCDPLYLTLTISDNGIGIPAEFQNKVFDMFFRVSGEREGSGIGLYIVKETIAKLQGKIEVDSREHEGTTFKIRLKNFLLQ